MGFFKVCFRHKNDVTDTLKGLLDAGVIYLAF